MKPFVDHHLKNLDKLIEHAQFSLEKGQDETTVEKIALHTKEKQAVLFTLREVREQFERDANAYLGGELFE